MTSTLEPSGLLARVGAESRLVGSRCTVCATHVFPVQSACPRCGSPTEAVALPAAGTLWSWTVQRVRPKLPYLGPEEFEPFAVGYIDLGTVRVEARLAGRPVERWLIGEPLRLVAGPTDDAGNVWTYCFEPVEAETP